MPAHLYRVWVADAHEHENAERLYTEYDPYLAATKHAEFHDSNNCYEGDWPRDFIVRDLGEVLARPDNHGDMYRFNIDRESVPTYRPYSYTPPKLELGIHDRMTAHGEYICSCAHPIGYGSQLLFGKSADACTKCLCASGKRFFTMDDGGATYHFVARDVEHAKQVLRESGAELTKEDGDSASVDDPAFADLVWEEHTQDEASRIKCHPDDGGKPSQPLTTYELGAWFCSEY